MSNYIVTTFYKFVNLDNVREIQLALYKSCYEHNILGTILLAEEGVNSTLVGDRKDIDQFYAFVESLGYFDGIEYKESECEYKPFSRLKVKIKPETIKFCIDALDTQKAGEKLAPEDWEKLLDSGAMVIDTRNDYEIEFGTFVNAVNPKTKNFTDLVDWVEKNLQDYDKEKPIGMFCTGGVRCEKSTAYLIQKGFKKVYHLDGGVMQYFIKAKNKAKYWIGRCFVFDDRVAVDVDLKPYATSK
ncbi:MAG: rhodanese-related sulfurtransferase [Alphaproteobacteria bacterium]|jgi:UPF0176 protein|nr:hypothetical protein [Candidatus Jidaibacter sp.]